MKSNHSRRVCLPYLKINLNVVRRRDARCSPLLARRLACGRGSRLLARLCFRHRLLKRHRRALRGRHGGSLCFEDAFKNGAKTRKGLVIRKMRGGWSLFIRRCLPAVLLVPGAAGYASYVDCERSLTHGRAE